jgi:hypothetical protein
MGSKLRSEVSHVYLRPRSEAIPISQPREKYSTDLEISAAPGRTHHRQPWVSLNLRTHSSAYPRYF